MGSPLVSIVTPCYNGAPYLRRFLESVLNQNYSRIELVFVNDGSVDDTENIVKEYWPKFNDKGYAIIYRSQDNKGQAAAVNIGLKLFTGDYLLWLDSDDSISVNYVSDMLSYFEKSPKTVYCYGETVWIDELTGKKTGETQKRENTNGKSFFEDILMVNHVFYSGYMVKTALLERVLHNREIFDGPGGQNAQLLLPLAWTYGEPDFVSGCIYYYYIRDNSHSHSINNEEKIISQYKNYEKLVEETLYRIDDEKVFSYFEQARKKYASIRFGNAVDSENPDLICEEFRNLKKTKNVTFRQWLLWIKHGVLKMRS